jgi:8-oxo-dGTP diphosphatase
MISVRTMTGAFLIHHDDVLMLKRSKNKKIAPGLWSCIGGHVEPYEHGSPENCCLREIEEETGIPRTEIENLTLRYILLRRKEDELNQHYIFFGHSKTRTIGSCDEGELHWVKLSEMAHLQMSLSLKLMVEHYLHHSETDHVWTGTFSDGKMLWAPLSK